MDANQILAKIRANMESVIVGKPEAIELVLACLLCGGHVLIEDMPGLGKTSLVQALSQSVDCSFQRIQFTPDVLPSDITGFTMFHPATGEKEFHPGAVMSQVVLADEVNRTSPKTQSALLEAMQEGRVTVDGVTHQLPRPFMVCATQNPVELAGTYPLPEAQLDRFLMRISIGYPAAADEVSILERNRSRGPVALSPVASSGDILALQDMLESIVCSRPVMAYIVELARRTREHGDVTLGVSPRGSISLMRASMAKAMMSGRTYVLPDDVQAMAGHVLCHRMALESQASIRNQTPESVLEEILQKTPVPAVT